MTTVDIKSTYGALGDSQKATAVLTISSSSPNLSSTTNLWSSGDVGKKISVVGAGTVDANTNPLGALWSSIKTFTDSKHIILNDNATTALSTATKVVEWGTDDGAAFDAFNAAGIGQTNLILNIPAGRYFVGPASSVTHGRFTWGISGLTITGAVGSPSTSILTDFTDFGGYLLGSGSLFNDASHHVLMRTSSLADTTLTAVNLSDSNLSAFANNTWALMTGYDSAGIAGYPQDPYFSEYVFITNISSGVFTLQSPLRNRYVSTWPNYIAGSGGAIYEGGPGTLYALDNRASSTWNVIHEYRDLGLEQRGLINSTGNSITFTRGNCSGGGIFPSSVKNWNLTNYTHPSLIEVDKVIDTVTINGGTFYGFDFQNPAPINMTMTDATVTTIMNGTAQNFTATGCSFPTVFFSSHSYPGGGSVNLNNCTITGLGINTSGESGIFGVSDYTTGSSGGIFTRTLVDGPSLWAVPGGYATISGDHSQSYVFKIIDVTTDGTNTLVNTNLPSNWETFVPHVNGSGFFVFNSHPCVNMTLTGCTGCDPAVAFSNAPANKPFGAYASITYTGDIGSTPVLLPIFGNLISLTVTVNHAYAGSNSPKLDLSTFINSAGNANSVLWAPLIDLKTAGTRTISFATGSQVITGTAGTDSGLACPNNSRPWINSNQIIPAVTASMSDDLTCSVTITYNLDQGIVTRSSGLRLGLHS